MEYTIKFWEDDEMRELGESSIHTSKENKGEAIEEARRLFNRQDYPAVEVDDEEGNCIFHISFDAPDGEEY